MKVLLIGVTLFGYSFTNVLTQDFLISETGNAQFAPAIAADSKGNFVVVWTDYRDSSEYSGADSGSSIYGQFYSNNGIKLNDNFRICEDTLVGGNRIPSVSMNTEGNFVVVWHKSNNKSWGDLDIYARIFNKNGEPQTSSFKVNDDTTSKAQLDAKVLLQDDGNFIIAWADRRDDLLFAYAQLFDNLGNPVGKNYKINSNNIEDVANMSSFTDGKFLFHWGKYIQIYNNDGTQFSDVINIELNGTSFAKGKDSILVLWNMSLTTEIWGRFFDLNGNQISQSFRIDDVNQNSKIAYDVDFSNEEFIIVWQDHRNDFPGVIGNGDIYAQRFNWLVEPLGENFKVNHERKELTQRNPSVVLRNNTFVTVWLQSYPKCFPVGTIGMTPSYIMGTIQKFSGPISGEVFGWETLRDSCEESSPSETKILNNYPNPFYSETTIDFSLSENSLIDMSIYNILGEKITTLANNYLVTGNYKIKFDASDLSSGIYIILIKGNNFVLSSKITVIH